MSPPVSPFRCDSISPGVKWSRIRVATDSGDDRTIRGLRQPLACAAALADNSPVITFWAVSGSSRFSRARTVSLVSDVIGLVPRDLSIGLPRPTSPLAFAAGISPFNKASTLSAVAGSENLIHATNAESRPGPPHGRAGAASTLLGAGRTYVVIQRRLVKVVAATRGARPSFLVPVILSLEPLSGSACQGCRTWRFRARRQNHR